MTALAKLPGIIGSMLNFADVADRCELTEGNAPAAIRAWANQLAALSPAELGGVEKRARELLAAEMREFYPSTADRLVDQGIPAESFPHSTEAAIRAIASALSTPRAAEAVSEEVFAIVRPYLQPEAREKVRADLTAALTPPSPGAAK